ncbi:MAG TPA: hypothetical protein ENH57_04370 [Actinobacteria bacterium]|nr:hypothetical protein [Actinomycetota bacterium]
MQKKQTNYEVYEKLASIIRQKPSSSEYIPIIEQLEPEPDYPIDEPVVFDLVKFALAETAKSYPAVVKRVNSIEHIIEADYQTFDRFHYDLLATYLYDLSEHLAGEHEPKPVVGKAEIRKLKAFTRLVESLAAISTNNAQIA